MRRWWLALFGRPRRRRAQSGETQVRDSLDGLYDDLILEAERDPFVPAHVVLNLRECGDPHASGLAQRWVHTQRRSRMLWPRVARAFGKVRRHSATVA